MFDKTTIAVGGPIKGYQFEYLRSSKWCGYDTYGPNLLIPRNNSCVYMDGDKKSIREYSFHPQVQTVVRLNGRDLRPNGWKSSN